MQWSAISKRKLESISGQLPFCPLPDYQSQNRGNICPKVTHLRHVLLNLVSRAFVYGHWTTSQWVSKSLEELQDFLISRWPPEWTPFGPQRRQKDRLPKWIQPVRELYALYRKQVCFR